MKLKISRVEKKFRIFCVMDYIYIVVIFFTLTVFFDVNNARKR